ncbi:MAG: tetratricopeptide repeat protein [Pirellulales bacterium]
MSTGTEENTDVEQDASTEEAADTLMSKLLTKNSLILSGGGLLLCVLVWFICSTFFSSKAMLEPIEMALHYLEEDDPQRARQLAGAYIDNLHIPEDLQGIPPYVLGVAAHQEADQIRNPRDQERVHRIAAEHLGNAVERFPLGYEAQGQYYLGSSLFESKQFQKSIPVLNEAYKTNSEHKAEIEELLAIAYLEEGHTNPELLKDALEWTEKFLENKTINPTERENSLVRKGYIQLSQGNVSESLKTIEPIAESSPRYNDVRIIKGTIFFDRAKAAMPEPNQPVSEDLKNALALFREASNAQLSAGDSTRKASYLQGLALELARDNNALEQFTRTRKIYLKTAESIAAGLKEAAMLSEIDLHDKAIAVYRKTLREAGTESRYRNPWVSLPKFNQLITEAIQFYSEPNLFRYAIEICHDLTPLFPIEQALETEADVLVDWAESLEGRAVEVSLAEGMKMRTEARLRFRQAGFISRQLAKKRFSTKQYTDDLWSSADSYIRGQDFTEAAEILTEYRLYETRAKKPRSLVAMARVLIDLDRASDAITPLAECIEFYPKDPSTYRARLLAADAYLELGEIPLAKEMLQSNLDDGELEPSSKEWQESLFAMGRVYHLEGELLEAQARVKGISEEATRIPKEALELLEQSTESYQKAIRNLHIAVRRYPDAPDATMARYLIAECHRRASMLPKKKYRLVSIETQRVKFDKQVKEHLETALEIYKQLETELTNRFELKGELHPVEALMLKNSYFAQGSALFELKRYQESIEAYSTASNSYQNEPASLEAYVQIAHCYRFKGQPKEGKSTLEQAKKVLSKLPDNADYSQSSQSSEDDWEKFLNWLASTL